MLSRSHPQMMCALLGDDVFPKSFGRVLSHCEDELILSPSLDSIPSETTPSERRFLYNFIKYFWEGNNDILEIGPFLGGTTRAIALGMLHNSKRHPASLLYTFDKFDEYYSPDSLLKFTDPLFQKGEIPPELRTKISSSQKFKDLFQMIHKKHKYSTIINAQVGILRDTSGENKYPIESYFSAPLNTKIGIIFVDGCKSWYGTKHFMIEMCTATTAGSYYIFQDYCWYTCFWISAFVELFADYFGFVGSVDNTYTYFLKKPLKDEVIHTRFPDSPEEFSINEICKLFDRIIVKHAAR
jgi:hypothetical protein